MLKKTILVLALAALCSASFLEKYPKLEKIFNYISGKHQSPALPAAKAAAYDAEFVVGGWGADLTLYSTNGQSRVLGHGDEFFNTSWITPAREGMLITNMGKNLISFVDFRGGHAIHALKNLTRPVMIGETSNGEGHGSWYVACHGMSSASLGSGIAVGVAHHNWTVYEHEVPDHFNPGKPSNTTSVGQKVSKIEAINEHAWMDDYVIAADAGWDHIYHYGLNEWKQGLQIIYSFERGFGPHNFAFSESRRFMYVSGEYTPGFAVLMWDANKKTFEEVARKEILAPNQNWTGADIIVDKQYHVYVSIRHSFNQSGYVIKYEHTHNSQWGHGFREVAKSQVGAFPSRIWFTPDQEGVIVTNEFGDSVEILDTKDLKVVGGFKTPGMHPFFAHELQKHHPHPHGPHRYGK